MILRGELHWESHYTTVPNAWARDTRISRKARGLLLELLSHRPGWRVTLESLIEGGPEGKDSLRSGIAELEEAGYLRRTRERDKEGKLGGALWTLRDPFADLPNEDPPTEENPTEANPPLRNTTTRNLEDQDLAIPSETASPTESADAESTRRTPPEKRDAGTLIGAWVTGHVAGKNSQPHEGQRRRFAKAAREFVTGSPPLDELAPEQWLRLVDTAYVLGSHCEYAILDAFLGGNGRPPRLPASCCYRIGSRGSIAEAQARNIDQPVAPWEAP